MLYVDDSGYKHLRSFEVRPDGTLTNSRILVDMASEDLGVPDGLKVDLQGNVFCTGPGGVWVCRPTGQVLGRVLLPEVPSNLAWGEVIGNSSCPASSLSACSRAPRAPVPGKPTLLVRRVVGDGTKGSVVAAWR